MLTKDPAWREAKSWETPGQLEPQLENDVTEEVLTHLLDDKLDSLCKTAIFGDRAITIEQAMDMSTDLKFNCEKCFKILTEMSNPASK